MAFWSSYSPPSLYLSSTQLVIDCHKHRDNDTLQIQSQLPTMSFFAGSSFPPSNSGRVTILEADDDLPERVAFWNEDKDQDPSRQRWHIKKISFCSYLSKTMKMRNGCKRNCLINIIGGTCTIYKQSTRLSYNLFISEEESLWRKNCEQSLDICFNKSSLSSSLHLSLVLFHLLIWLD